MFVLIPALGLVLVLLLLAGGAYVVLRLAGRDGAGFSFRSVVAVYVAIVSGLSLLVLALGLSLLLNAAFGSVLGREFSYRPQTFGGGVTFSSAGSGQAAAKRAEAPDSAADQRPATSPAASGQPTPVPSATPAPPPTPVISNRPATATPEIRARQAVELEQQQRTGLVQGTSLAVTGFLLWGLHRFVRRAAGAEDSGVAPAPLGRTYVAVMLALFSLIGVVAVPTAVAQAASYFLAPPPEGTLPGPGPEPPGGTLATALVVVPFWAHYLWVALRSARATGTPDTAAPI